MKTRVVKWVEVEPADCSERKLSEALMRVLRDKKLNSSYEMDTPRPRIFDRLKCVGAVIKSPYLIDAEFNEAYEDAHDYNRFQRNFYTVDRVAEYRAKRDRLEGIA